MLNAERKRLYERKKDYMNIINFRYFIVDELVFIRFVVLFVFSINCLVNLEKDEENSFQASCV